MEDDPEIIYSQRCAKFMKDDVVVDLQIFRLETEPGWSLEVVNSAGTSIVWDDLFETDEQAYEEFLRTVREEGMIAFADEPITQTVSVH